MAAGAGVALGNTFEQLGLRRAMWLMAIKTAHTFFLHWMMGKEAKLGFNLWMAAITKVRHLLVAYLLLWPLVQLMATEAAKVV